MDIKTPSSGFFEAYIACPHEEDAAPFLELVEDRGYIWLSGAPLTSKTEWKFYEKETIYHLNPNGRVSITDYADSVHVYSMREFFAAWGLDDEIAIDISMLM